MRKNPQDFKSGITRVTVDDLIAMGVSQEMIDVIMIFEPVSVLWESCPEIGRIENGEEDI